MPVVLSTGPVRNLRTVAVVTVAFGLAGFAGTPASAGTTPQCVKAIQQLHGGAGGLMWLPAASSNTTNCFMHQGSVSDGVWAMQRALRVCYSQNIAVDSSFGPNTKNALINVQRILGISADGGYGIQTRTAMKFTQASGPDKPTEKYPPYNPNSCLQRLPVT